MTDTTLFFALLTLGSICFGRFEDWKPRWRRVLKIVIVSSAFIGLLLVAGRLVAWGMVGAVLCAAAWVHLVWLPRHGVNGWTAEPRERYLELVDPARRRAAGLPQPVRRD